MHAYKVVEYYILDTKATIVLGHKKTQRFIFLLRCQKIQQ